VTRSHLRALALACLATAAPSQTSPEVDAVQVEAPWKLRRIESLDLDGDGLDDLVCVVADDTRRELWVHTRRAERPLFAPPAKIALDADVVAFAFVRGKAGGARSLLLFTPDRAVESKEGADGARAYRELFAHQIVWPAAPQQDCVPVLEWTLDLDGDGDDDFALPEPDGARIVLQESAAEGSTFRVAAQWTLPPFRDPVALRAKGKARARSGNASMRLSFGDDEEGDDGVDARSRGPLLAVRTRSSTFRFADLDGDGLLDGYALRNESLWQWRQARAGEFAAAPEKLSLPMPEDRLPLFDPAFDAQLRDVDQDGRADLLLSTSASRDNEIETRIEFYLHAKDTSQFESERRSRMRLQTLAGEPQWVDVDGDGARDLAALTLRTDLLGGMMGESPMLDVQLNLFRFADSRFTTPALLTQKLQFAAKRRRGGGAFVRVVEGSKGSPGAVLVNDGDAIVLRPLAASGRKLTLLEAAWRAPTQDSAVPLPPKDGRRELFVVGDREVQLVRWQ
jgi:FG-GAP-like repeat